MSFLLAAYILKYTRANTKRYLVPRYLCAEMRIEMELWIMAHSSRGNIGKASRKGSVVDVLNFPPNTVDAFGQSNRMAAQLLATVLMVHWLAARTPTIQVTKILDMVSTDTDANMLALVMLYDDVYWGQAVLGRNIPPSSISCTRPRLHHRHINLLLGSTLMFRWYLYSLVCRSTKHRTNQPTLESLSASDLPRKGLGELGPISGPN